MPGLDDPVIGFLDEAKIVLDPAKRRVLNTRFITYRESVMRPKPNSWSIFGFMAIDGKDVVMASRTAKAADMLEFLKLVRKENPERQVVIIIDNAAIHHSKLVTANIEGAGIFLIFLPPYSPDLNPIEFSWKDIKRELRKILSFDEMINNAEQTAVMVLKQHKMGYTARWREKFNV